MLTNEIYKSWSGTKASEYKEYKGIRKESLRDNMSDVEIILTDLGEVATRELAKKYNLYGLEENKLGDKVITNNNSLGYEYIDENKSN